MNSIVPIVAFIVAALTTAATWLLLSSVLSWFGGVGAVELILLLGFAIAPGAWAAHRILRAFRHVDDEPRF
jgi:hypothetical protein